MPVATTSSPPLRSTPLGEAAAAYDLFVVGTVLASRWRLNFPRLRALYIELTHPNQRSISTHLLTQQLPILVGALARNPLAAYILEATEPDGELLPGAPPLATPPVSHTLASQVVAQALAARPGARPGQARVTVAGKRGARDAAADPGAVTIRDLLLESEDPTCCLRLHYEVLPPKDACEPRLEATWNTPTIASDECIRM
ncbi:hypothetical protein F751_6111 [Auxenochlorella protothecoides]|uniref:Uncharacterized protein n=1 Tax=Auxenochlorella protothecoides TaxID=3075 RepID=A0A087SHF1_AUXPR|nr:hypothetical protein F751_6111 [Auxenochlorella protothecoides]KFM25155.1 hypothetical protein F751_6111 [Auxenochlorella protothecoides]